MKRSGKWIHSPECDEAMAFYVAGHSVRETAEKFGVTTVQINNVVKSRGLTNGRSWRQGSKEYDKKLKKEAEERLEAILERKGFVYCGGYTDRSGKVEIACKTCGSKFINCVDTVRRGVVVCHVCVHERTFARETERKAESAKRQEELEAKWAEQKRQTQIRKQRERDAKLDKVYVCKICGKEYTSRQYMESEGLTLFSNVGYCSHACKRKAMNKAKKMSPSGKTGHYYDRARKYGVEYIPGITLKKVVARDGLRCAICGGMCDWNDHTWSSCSGPLYPSVDHIIPMAKGGPHIWENVQVAHVMCNSEKGDKVSV